MDNSSKLGDGLHQSISTRIEADYFAGTTPVEHPKVVITGGQPGSGKSKLLESSKELFPDGNVVVINGDDLRNYHPQAEKILRSDDKSFATSTDLDSREWTRELFEKAIETKRNIIFESTMRDPGPISKTMERLKAEGYEITAKVVAANERESTTGIYKRYEGQKAERGYGRFSEKSSHDAAYEGVPKTVEHIEKNQLVDRMEVYSRDGKQLYANEAKEGQWEKAPEAAEAIRAERERMPSLREIEQFRNDWREINDRMTERKAAAKEIEQAKDVQKNLEASLDRQFEKAKQAKQREIIRFPNKEERDRDDDLTR